MLRRGARAARGSGRGFNVDSSKGWRANLTGGGGYCIIRRFRSFCESQTCRFIALKYVPIILGMIRRGGGFE